MKKLHNGLHTRIRNRYGKLTDFSYISVAVQQGFIFRFWLLFCSRALIRFDLSICLPRASCPKTVPLDQNTGNDNKIIGYTAVLEFAGIRAD